MAVHQMIFMQGAVHKLLRHLGGGGVSQLSTLEGVFRRVFITKKLKLST